MLHLASEAQDEGPVYGAYKTTSATVTNLCASLCCKGLPLATIPFAYIRACKNLCRFVSAYRCKCCRTYNVRELSAVRFGLWVQDAVDKWSPYNLCRIVSVATHSPGHLPVIVSWCAPFTFRYAVQASEITKLNAIHVSEMRNSHSWIAALDSGWVCEVRNSYSRATPSERNSRIRFVIRVRSAQFP